MKAFTGVLKLVVSEGSFCCSNTAPTNDDSAEVGNIAISLHEVCNIYELVSSKASCLVLPYDYEVSLLAVLVDAIRTSTMDVETFRGERQTDHIILYQENDLKHRLDEWLLSEGRMIGEYNKKSSAKRSRANRLSSGAEVNVFSVKASAKDQDITNKEIDEKRTDDPHMEQPSRVDAPIDATEVESDGKRRRLESREFVEGQGKKSDFSNRIY